MSHMFGSEYDKLIARARRANWTIAPVDASSSSRWVVVGYFDFDLPQDRDDLLRTVFQVAGHRLGARNCWR
jgi:hypothetical protein